MDILLDNIFGLGKFVMHPVDLAVRPVILGLWSLGDDIFVLDLNEDLLAFSGGQHAPWCSTERSRPSLHFPPKSPAYPLSAHHNQCSESVCLLSAHVFDYLASCRSWDAWKCGAAEGMCFINSRFP